MLINASGEAHVAVLVDCDNVPLDILDHALKVVAQLVELSSSAGKATRAGSPPRAGAMPWFAWPSHLASSITTPPARTRPTSRSHWRRWRCCSPALLLPCPVRRLIGRLEGRSLPTCLLGNGFRCTAHLEPNDTRRGISLCKGIQLLGLRGSPGFARVRRTLRHDNHLDGLAAAVAESGRPSS